MQLQGLTKQGFVVGTASFVGSFFFILGLLEYARRWVGYGLEGCMRQIGKMDVFGGIEVQCLDYLALALGNMTMV